MRACEYCFKTDLHMLQNHLMSSNVQWDDLWFQFHFTFSLYILFAISPSLLSLHIGSFSSAGSDSHRQAETVVWKRGEQNIKVVLWTYRIWISFFFFILHFPTKDYWTSTGDSLNYSNGASCLIRTSIASALLLPFKACVLCSKHKRNGDIL